MARTRTTKQLSDALYQIQAEAVTRIGFFLKKSKAESIPFKDKSLQIHIGTKNCIVSVLYNTGKIKVKEDAFSPNYYYSKIYNLLDLSADALLTILDELERMKKESK